MSQAKEFLQSRQWLAFQKATGNDVVSFVMDGFSANGIFYMLPLVGKYLYIPKGPIFIDATENMKKLLDLAKEQNVKWIRIEPENETAFQEIQKASSYKIVPAPHDIQPKELLVMDITLDENALLSCMKSKTRYNIRLAEKRGVKVFATRDEKYKQAFFDLITATSDRKDISPHPRAYYEKFFEIFPPEMCQLFIAEYDGEVLAANILILFEGRAIYLHGGSSDRHRDVMAPFLLQWKQICFAKQQGCREYDFGGVKILNQRLEKNDWSGITRFKQGFSPETVPTVYPGTFDIIIDSRVYFLYRTFRTFKNFIYRSIRR